MEFSFVPTPEVANPQEYWRRIREQIAAVTNRPRDIANELLHYHQLVTEGIELPPFTPELCANGVLSLLTIRSEASPNLSGEAAKLAFRSILEGDHLRKIEVGETSNVGGVEYTFGPIVRGGLRQWGRRKCHDGSTSESIFGEVSFDVRTNSGVRHYLAPRTKLNAVFSTFADSSDALFVQARTEEDQLMAIASTQLWGASVIHPFFGANRRAFELQMMSDLARVGYVLEQPLKSETGKSLLANRGSDFLVEFLASLHINLPTVNNLLSFKKDAYYEALSTAIIRTVSGGNKKISKDLIPQIRKSANLIKKNCPNTRLI